MFIIWRIFANFIGSLTTLLVILFNEEKMFEKSCSSSYFWSLKTTLGLLYLYLLVIATGKKLAFSFSVLKALAKFYAVYILADY